MQVNNCSYETIWMEGLEVLLIDQTKLPFSFEIYKSKNYKETSVVIKTMIVRGAGAIGAAAGYAMAQAAIEYKNRTDYIAKINEARKHIESTRPTAQNLFYATQKVYEAALISPENAIATAKQLAQQNSDDCKKIGEYGNKLIKEGYCIETHCNAGWLAFVDWGSALSPIFYAHRQGKNISVLVDETRPRSQGARLTAWELKNENIDHKIIPDNAGAWLMSQNRVDMMIVGADRIAANGDVANKIGTLEKAIAAKEFGIPFYVAAPSSTIDFNCASGKEITIEERDEEEIHFQTGPDNKGAIHTIRVTSPDSTALNPAFDVTPAKYITGIITEKGIITPNKLKKSIFK